MPYFNRQIQGGKHFTLPFDDDFNTKALICPKYQDMLALF